MPAGSLDCPSDMFNDQLYTCIYVTSSMLHQAQKITLGEAEYGSSLGCSPTGSMKNGLLVNNEGHDMVEVLRRERSVIRKIKFGSHRVRSFHDYELVFIS